MQIPSLVFLFDTYAKYSSHKKCP